ncbi:MAG: purine-nucleoside phosphorylase, partial [Bacteroidota bacterium]
MDVLQESVRFLKSKVSQRPRTAVVLGSGLGGLARRLTDKSVIESTDIPYYPVPQVEGHAGKLVFGRVPSSRKQEQPFILTFLGRPHFYESGDLDRVTYSIRLAHRLGVRNLILTNAAGSINRMFSPGDLMLITGHVNLTFANLRFSIGGGDLRTEASPDAAGTKAKGVARSFPERIYDLELLELARRAAQEEGIPLREGVYCGVTGPSYETAAEIEMLRRIGADAVGMSTVHEAMVGSRRGMRVLGISLVTNLATGLAKEPASHEEVIRVARQARKKFETLLMSVLALL